MGGRSLTSFDGTPNAESGSFILGDDAETYFYVAGPNRASELTQGDVDIYSAIDVGAMAE